MFTGIVEEIGVVVAATAEVGGTTLRVEGPRTISDLDVGDSVAINGTCLTAVSVDAGSGAFLVELVPETLHRTCLGDIREGSRVNLERAMPASGRFDGHIVQGHVDGVGEVVAVDSERLGSRIRIEALPSLLVYMVEKGSITVDGVSLTIASIQGNVIDIALIPHTLEATTLGSRAIGDRVNLEVDILAKYVERLMKAQQ